MESDKISQKVKDSLQKQYKSLNPAQLQRSMKKKLEKVKELMRKKKETSVTVSNHATPLRKR